MILKTIILSVVVMAVLLLIFSIKLFFKKDAEINIRSCSMDDNGNCDKCQITDATECAEEKQET
ncbi:hypothetical protein ACE1ET_09150 [Saccharicrinis sp. FJH62]|uniref:hypothetical protein n=1 Tax=Saccharicrinis sp. FJH62 TaxID=3344657 RepID=UPI0035D41F03